MKTFFEPRGVVVVGARRSPGFGMGLPVVLLEHGWGDRLRLVNPAGGEMHGLPVYTSVAQVPDPADLAVVIVPAAHVPQVLDEIGQRGIRHVILESAGFAETGEAGRALQARAGDVARRYGIRIIGPNCVGVFNSANGLATTEIIPEAFPPGKVAVIAQSGVFGNILLDRLHQDGLFFSKTVTMGNRMDVNECDILEYLREDPATSVIMMYLEGAANGRLLKETLARVTRRKPVLILKSGRTEEGRQATASHTGSLSGQDRLYEGLFAQTGAVRAASLDELISLARVFATQPLPSGPRLGIVTASGSMGALATDVAVAMGLKVPALAESVAQAVRKNAPGWMNVRNPLDVGPSSQFAPALTAMAADPGTDMVLAVATIPHAIVRQFKSFGITPAHWFGDLAALRDTVADKPFLACVVGNSEFVDQMKLICGPRLPVFTSPEPCARALAALWRYNLHVKANPCAC